MDDTSKAYACYQQAIAKLPHSKVSFKPQHCWPDLIFVQQGEPKLWYGIGILYDRHNSLNMAEEAFVNVINHDPSMSRPPSLLEA